MTRRSDPESAPARSSRTRGRRPPRGARGQRVASEAERGACIVNVGNQHTLALLVRGEELFGVMEHHTEAMTTEKLERLVGRLIEGTITHDEVFDDDGHGAMVLDEYQATDPFTFVAVTGNRAMASPRRYFAAPTER